MQDLTPHYPVTWKVMPGNMPDGGDSQALRRPLCDGEQNGEQA